VLKDLLWFEQRNAVPCLRIAYCVTCKGRSQHIKMTLPANLAAAASYPDAIFILLDYGSPDDLLEYLKASHSRDIESGRLIVYSHVTDGPFRMAHAKNMAHRLGIHEKAGVLVNLDADNYVSGGFTHQVAEVFVNNPDSFMSIDKIEPGVTPRGVCGRIVCSAKAFMLAGGYDECFETWSPDDKDFNRRLKMLNYNWVLIPTTELECVRHNDKIRFKEYKHAAKAPHSEQLVLEARNDTVVNAGRIGCGIVSRNFTDDHVTLAPVPSRIFGIGAHKTATTSLHHALEILGIDSAHWQNAHWAKRIWREMNTMGVSRTLERHYALCDSPIPNLFKKLDMAYPGSKFILTIRNETAWLDSVRRHWDPAHNKYRGAWDNDPFTHVIHEATYGRRDFDAETMLRCYRTHNSRVLAHFKDRPQDLLVFNADNPRWDKLCAFLQRPVPSVEYPQSNWSGAAAVDPACWI